MTVPFMDAYVQLLIQTCHKRGVHAMVSTAASIRGFLGHEKVAE